MNTKLEQAANEELQDNPITKLVKDLRDSARLMTQDEARFLVDAYYQMQGNRVRSDEQIRSMKNEPHAVLQWISDQALALENQVKSALAAYAKATPMCVWAMAVDGIGPVLSVGLQCHIDINQAPTVGHIWSFAGLNPTAKWEKGKKRPWNAALKVICWKIGESFVKVCNKETAVYGHVYNQRKDDEFKRNYEGKLVEQAALGAARVKKSTDAWPWYAGCYKPETYLAWVKLEDGKAREQLLKTSRGAPGSGLPMLPPGHIQARAKRYAVKLFLAHWHAEAYRKAFGKEPPLPYPIAMLAGHTHLINSDGTTQVVQKPCILRDPCPESSQPTSPIEPCCSSD